MMRRTKIICTIGPATESLDNLKALVEAGMDVARLNFSHGSHEFHGETIKHLRKISSEWKKPLAILQDLCGPKIRLGILPPEGIEVQMGEEVTFVCAEEGNTSDTLPLPIPTLFAMARIGEPILINDGRIKLVVSGRDADTIRAVVKIGGLLSSRKGVNLPETRLPVSSVTEKDIKDLRFGIQSGVDWVAVSFVRSPSDIEPVRRMIEAGGANIRIIAKIEKREAVDSFDEILKVVDGIMIARGDLGVEMPINEVPLIQKEIINRCNNAGKPVIVATQMLESMINAPDPTRAEATDVANSILDGTDAVMLSGETAVGKFPIPAVEVMQSIAARTEQALPEGYQKNFSSYGVNLSITESVAEAVCRIATQVGARAIFCNTSSGDTARMVSKYRPKTPIIAFTPKATTYNQLALCWGTQPYLISEVRTAEQMLMTVIKAAAQMELAERGDKVVITSGVPIGIPGSTSLIKLHTIGEPISP